MTGTGQPAGNRERLAGTQPEKRMPEERIVAVRGFARRFGVGPEPGRGPAEAGERHDLQSLVQRKMRQVVLERDQVDYACEGAAAQIMRVGIDGPAILVDFAGLCLLRFVLVLV